MIKIETISRMQDIIKANKKISLFIHALWCVDSNITFQNLENDNRFDDLYYIRHDNFSIFCNEFNINNFPTVINLEGFDVVNKLSTGEILSNKKILEFIKEFQGE